MSFLFRLVKYPSLDITHGYSEWKFDKTLHIIKPVHLHPLLPLSQQQKNIGRYFTF